MGLCESWKFHMRFCALLEVPRGTFVFMEVPGILCIILSQSWDFVHCQKIIVGFRALFEVNHGILCIFGRSSWDFVHIWKFHL
jgi:hypothetical protein